MIHDRQRLLGEADAAASRRDWAEAARLLETVGNDSYVLDKRVFFLSLAKRFDEALELLVELRNRDPKNARYLYMTGSQYYEQQKYAQALPWFEAGLQLNPRHIKMWWRVAYAQHCAGNETAACAAASQVLKIWSTLPKDEQDRSLSVRAKALHLLGKTYLTYHPHLALPLLEQAALDAPNDPYNLYCLGKAQRVMTRPEEALATQRRAIKLKAGRSAHSVGASDLHGTNGRQRGRARDAEPSVRSSCRMGGA